MSIMDATGIAEEPTPTETDPLDSKITISEKAKGVNIQRGDPTCPARPVGYSALNIHQGAFFRAKLMAGLRRHLAAPNLKISEIHPRPLPTIIPGSLLSESGTTLSAMAVGVIIDGEHYSLSLLLKEPPITSDGRVLQAVGQREYGIYNRLAAHLPLLVPALIAGDQYEGWIVLEGVAGMRPVDTWQPEDYYEAVENLVTLHDRFYGAGEDLSVFPYLGRPFDADYQATVIAGAEAGTLLLNSGRLPQFTEEPYRQLVMRVIQSAERIAAPLLAQTPTLVHGDYWPGNIARLIDGRQMVFDWQMASVAPGILDYVGFVQATLMRVTPPLSIDELTNFYRAKVEATMHTGWDDPTFALLWDHALLWLFFTRWLGRLATLPPSVYNGLHPLFETVWLAPLCAAAEKRL